MIKLERDFHPVCLNPAEVARLTEIYKDKKTSVWNFSELKEALLKTSSGKCAYCECNLTKESKYMEVEHFLDKDTFPDQVVTWPNLLPSCKRCNGSKSGHNVVDDPIVNPYLTDPRDHFQFRLYRFRPKTKIATESLDVLDLNNSARAVMVRFEIGERLHDSLIKARERLETYLSNMSTRSRNLVLGSIKGILRECQSVSEYAATSATVLHSDTQYAHIKSELQRLGLWDQELIELDGASLMLKLDLC